MRVGEFELCVVNGLELRGSNEVQLRHGQTYQLALTNHGSVRCDVFLEIDGKGVGAWRIPAADSVILERPIAQEGCFTFFRLDSPEAKATSIPNEGAAGKVSAWFLPEIVPPEPPFGDRDLSLCAAKPEPVDGSDDPILSASSPSATLRKGTAGGTGLTGKSDQQFAPESEVFDYDDDASGFVEVWLTCEPVEEPDFVLRAESDTLASYSVFVCPDCQQRARVPAGIGRVKIKCPRCTCQFVRQT